MFKNSLFGAKKAILTAGMAFVLVLGGFLVTQTSHAQTVSSPTIEQLMAQVAELTRMLTQLLAERSATTGSTGTATQGTLCEYANQITKTLSEGMSDSQVVILQKFLNRSGTPVATTGVGSLGNETSYFGAGTERAVQLWQSKNSIVSSGSPETTGYGVVGSATRAKMKSGCGTEEFDERLNSVTITSPLTATPNTPKIISGTAERVNTLHVEVTAPNGGVVYPSYIYAAFPGQVTVSNNQWTITYQDGFPFAGNYTITIRENSSSGTVLSTRTLVVGDAASSAPVITTTTLPAATVGVEYGASIVSTGGTGTRNWEITSGALPPGIELDRVSCMTGDYGPCSQPATIPFWGKAQTPGTYRFTAKVTTGTQSDSKQFTIVVGSSQSAVTKIQIATGEYVRPGAVPRNQYDLGSFGGKTKTCSLISGALPFGVRIVNLADTDGDRGYSGCALVGVAGGRTGTYKITWKGEWENSQGNIESATSDLEITLYTPEAQLGFSSVCSGSHCKLCPDATVGESFSCKLGVNTSGNWTGKRIDFSLVWGIGGNPGGLTIPDNYYKPAIVGPEPTEADKTVTMSGVPQKAGTYQLTYCAGNGTESHTAFCRVSESSTGFYPFIVKPAPSSS